MFNIKKIINLENRFCLITGASGYLGKHICDVLAQLNCNLILIDLDDKKLKKLKNDILKRYKIKVMFYKCDLEDEKQRLNLIDKIKKKYKKLNIFINNAAFVGSSSLKGWSEKFENQSLETWRRAIEVNLTSVFHLTQEFSQIMKNSKGASIINIGSIYGMHAPDFEIYKGTTMNNPAAYSVSKSGLLHLTKWLSTYLAPNIRVNAISPGGIIRKQDKKFIKKYNARTPLKRMAVEEDLLGGIVYLSTDMSKYVTGQILSIDGGWGVQ